MAKEDKIQQILICAKELFGLYGYDKVSMRDIADRAGISVGNLTYYYGRKERIMLAVLDQINEEVSRPADIPGTLAEVDAMLERFSKIAAQSSCLFRRYSLDEQLGEKMLQCQKNLVRANRGLWAETLRSLERSGQLCGELYSGHYSELITAIQMVYRYWDGYAEMEESIGNRCPQFRQCIWSLLLPNLTDFSGLSVRYLRRGAPLHENLNQKTALSRTGSAVFVSIPLAKCREIRYTCS